MAKDIPAISWDTLFTSRGNEDYLGKGAFSQVYRCYHRARGDVAVKILSKSGNKDITSFSREGMIHLKATAFPNILNVLGITQHTGFVGLVLEYMPYGSLYELITEPTLDLPWTFRLRALQETAAAIAYLHNLSEDKIVVHCDIKAENILLTSDLHVKITDFGGADFATYTGTNIEPSVTSHQSQDRLLQYTLSHAPPEVVERFDAKRTTYMDVYSLGIVMYVVAARAQPFGNCAPRMIEHQIKQGRRPTAGLEEIRGELQARGDIDDMNILKLFMHLMQQCWKQTPKDRMTMIHVRDSLMSKLNSLPRDKVSEGIFRLKKSLPVKPYGQPADPITVWEKYKQINHDTGAAPDLRPLPDTVPKAQPVPQPVATPPRQNPPSSSPPQMPVSNLSGQKPAVSASDQSCRRKEPPPRPLRLSSTSVGLMELDNSFADPYLREGNQVRMISDIAAIKNAQVGHGGWNEHMMELIDMEGTVTRIEVSGDVTVTFSGVISHRFNPNALVKIPSEHDLHVGDIVMIELEKDLVQVYQEDHGGWVDEMHQFFSQPGLIFRFLPDKDALVVYKNGMYFRFNPEVLCKSRQGEELRYISLPDNPDIEIGDYVCHELDDELLKELQETSGGWNEAMSDLRGKVGKFVYADYHGRAFVAYNSKLCFVFNPAALSGLSEDEALRRFMRAKSEVKRKAKEVASIQTQQHRFAVGDVVRVHLPLDIVVELQRGNGGWCYQMLEVYGLQGIVKEFDENENAEVLFDTGTKWTFNPAALERLPPGGQVGPPSYTPPFRIGDKVKVRLQDHSNASLNKMRHAFRLLEIPEDKFDILMKSGEVLGIDDDIDVIVSFGDGKHYGLKPEQLQKI